VQSLGPSRGFDRNSHPSHSPHLSQLLSSRSSLAIRRHPPGFPAIPLIPAPRARIASAAVVTSPALGFLIGSRAVSLCGFESPPPTWTTVSKYGFSRIANSS
jgi:hypothetical protein